MGIYINGLDFNASSTRDEIDPSSDSAAEDKRGAMRTMAADFRFIEKLGATVPSLATMYDRKDGAKNVVFLATLLQRRALAA